MKRIHETNIWQQGWFGELPRELRLAWFYIWDHCDCAGIWPIHMKLLNFQCDTKLCQEQLIEGLGSRVRLLPGDLLLIVDFVSCVYGGASGDSNLHRAVRARMEQAGLEVKDGAVVMPTPCHDHAMAMPSGCHGDGFMEAPWSTQYKNKNKSTNKFNAPSIEEVKLQAAKVGLPEIEADKFWNYYQSNGWRVGRNPMKSWSAALVNWRTHYEQFSRNGGQGAARKPAGPDRNGAMGLDAAQQGQDILEALANG